MCLVGSRNDNKGVLQGRLGAEQNVKSEGRNQMVEALGPVYRALWSLYPVWSTGAVESERSPQPGYTAEVGRGVRCKDDRAVRRAGAGAGCSVEGQAASPQM